MNDNEILRLRDRYHSLANEVQKMRFEIDDLKLWRKEHTKESENKFDELQKLIDADITGKAVALAIKQRNKLELTFLQRIIASVICTLTIATSIRAFF